MSDNRPREKVLNAICAIAAKGEADRGSDGVVLFNRTEETASWVKLAELKTEELREATSDLLSEEGSHVYIIVEEDTAKHQVHFWKLLRSEVASRLQASNNIEGATKFTADTHEDEPIP